MKRRPTVRMGGTTAPAGYSVGYVHDVVGEDRDLRNLFSEADQKMYQIKRAKSRISALADSRRKRSHYDEAGVRAAEYTGTEMKNLLDSVSGITDRETVPVVADGTKGEQGDPGDPGEPGGRQPSPGRRG